MGIIVIMILFLYVGTVKVESYSITSITDPLYINAQNIQSKVTKMGGNCECIKYDCGCCEYMKWDSISLDGKLCINASYLDYSYGISVTMTFNNFTILNETVSARNPPPICVGEDIIKLVEIEICVRIFDIDIGHKFHACFEILGRFMKFYTPAIKLGCVNTEIQREIDYVKNNATSYLLLLLHKKKTENFKSPIVIVV